MSTRRNAATYLAGIICASGLLLLGPDRPCHGQGLLPIQFDPNGPAFQGNNGSLTYDASTGEFHGRVVPLTLSASLLPAPGFVTFSGNPQLSFDFFVNPDGTFRSDGDGFDLTGTISIGGTNLSGTLLSGDFTAFGAEPAGPPTWVANALLDTTGGLLTEPQPLQDGTSLPALFPPGSLPVGIDFLAESVTSGTLGDLTQDFGSGSVKGDGGLTSIPEPATWVLGMTAILILGLCRLARKRIAPAS